MLKDLKAKLSNAPVPEEVEKWRRRSKRSRHASQDYPSLGCRGMWVLQFSFGPNLQADWGHEVFAGFGCASYHSNSWPGSHESREGGKAGPCNHRRQTVPHQWDTLEAGLLCGLRGSQCPPIHPGFAHCYRGKAEESRERSDFVQRTQAQPSRSYFGFRGWGGIKHGCLQSTASPGIWPPSRQTKTWPRTYNQLQSVSWTSKYDKYDLPSGLQGGLFTH